MTINEAINGIDALKPNTYTTTDKIKWLSMLDSIIKLQVINTHELDIDEETGEEIEIDFEGYTDDTPLDTELLVKEPYTEMYITWLESKIDYANSEYVRFNNSVTHYNDLFQSFNNFYNRSHKPKSKTCNYF